MKVKVSMNVSESDNLCRFYGMREKNEGEGRSECKRGA